MGRDSLAAVAFGPEGLTFRKYPFHGASVREQPLVPISAIAEVIPDWLPPAIMTNDGEFLFIDTTLKEPLVAWAEGHGLPLVNRQDPWEYLLDPFLDTEYTQEADLRDRALLAEMGISDAETTAWRARVSGRMEALTVASWEWVHYGLYDVLFATKTFHPWNGLLHAQPFYDEVMAVARRGGTWPWQPGERYQSGSPEADPGAEAGALEVHVAGGGPLLKPRAFVTISLGDGCFASQTAARGIARWERIRPGEYHVTASTLGWFQPFKMVHGQAAVTPGGTTVVTLVPES